MKKKIQTTVEEQIADYFKNTFKKPSQAISKILCDFVFFTENNPSLSFFESPLELNFWTLDTARTLLRDAQRNIKGIFNHEELATIIAIMNATILSPGATGRMLLGNLEDMLPYEGPYDLDRKALDEIVKKYKKLGEFEKAYLELWAWAFWYAPKREGDRDLHEYIKKLT